MPQQLDVSRIEKHLRDRARTKPRITTAIVHPCSHDSLLGAIEAAREGLIEPVLVGPQSKIQAIAMEQELDISAYRLVDVPHSHGGSRQGRADGRQQ